MFSAKGPTFLHTVAVPHQFLTSTLPVPSSGSKAGTLTSSVFSAKRSSFYTGSTFQYLRSTLPVPCEYLPVPYLWHASTLAPYLGHACTLASYQFRASTLWLLSTLPVLSGCSSSTLQELCQYPASILWIHIPYILPVSYGYTAHVSCQYLTDTQPMYPASILRIHSPCILPVSYGYTAHVSCQYLTDTQPIYPASILRIHSPYLTSSLTIPYGNSASILPVSCGYTARISCQYLLDTQSIPYH